MANDVKNVSGGIFGLRADEFQVAGPQVLTRFKTQEAQPDAPAYIDVNDRLAVLSCGNNAGIVLTINLRILGHDGKIVPMKVTAAVPNSRVATIQTFPLIEGWLLSAQAVLAGGANTATYTYCSLGIARAPFTASDVYLVLVQGYPNSPFGLSYPAMQSTSPTAGAGLISSVVIGSPAAGADFSYAVPAGARQRIVSVSGLLTTAVAVANRDVTLVVDDGANIFCQVPAGFALAASLANQYTFADSCSQTAAFNSVSIAPLPSNLILKQNMRVRSLTANIQAADQWSAVTILVQDWQDQV